MKEWTKKIAYRAPFIQKFFWPKYSYKITPGQLFTLLQMIEETKEEKSSIIEIGVARGVTSAFILEHLATTKQVRPVFFLDTFDGFTPESVDVEVARGKPRASLDLFKYGNSEVFSRSLHSLGYKDFQVFSGDAAKFDYSRAAPIGAVLLDIDVYKPTLECLHEIWPHLSMNGGVVVDDCVANTLWDGSLQAVEEFCVEKNIVPIRVGGKGMLLRKRAYSGLPADPNESSLG